jgi:predicted enzyme related to lactoylglutathione lyase
MSCPIVWFEAVGQHADKLHSFYGGVLGWRFEPERTAPAPKSASARPAFFRQEPARSPEPPPWWVTFYTRVADLDAAIETARSLGGRLLVPPTRHGNSLLAVVADPEGHPLGLCS